MKENIVVEVLLFSPTGSTRRYAKAFTKGFTQHAESNVNVIEHDLTLSRESTALFLSETELVVFAMPVYGERIPHVAFDYLADLKGRGCALVALSVYGNVGYGITFEQYEGLSQVNDFNLIGAAALVAEHSYATENVPIALGRPTLEDLMQAESFGAKIAEKLLSGSASTIKAPQSPLPRFIANFPDRGTRFLLKQPVVDIDACTECGACAKRCPVSAIDSKTLVIEESKCLRCFNCAKVCPTHARRQEFRTAFFEKVFLRMAGQPKENRFFF